jgi:ferredoxin
MQISEKCVGCGICVDSCNFEAISLVEGKAIINQDLCVGCGLCREMCPFEAIEEVA